MYLVRAAGVPLSCGSLLLDSTPILPKPGAFVTFTRQFMIDSGKGVAVSIVPKAIHRGLVHLKWVLGARFELAKSRLAAWVPGKSDTGPSGGACHQTAFILRAAATGSYDRMIQNMFSKVFGRTRSAAAPASVVFLHNPEDPYLDKIDVESTYVAAGRIAPSVSKRLVTTGHVQTLFRKPRQVFEACEPQVVDDQAEGCTLSL